MNGRDAKYEIWKSDKDGKWYWRFRAANGETIASGQGYGDRRGPLNAISLLQKSAKTKIYSLTGPKE